MWGVVAMPKVLLLCLMNELKAVLAFTTIYLPTLHCLAVGAGKWGCVEEESVTPPRHSQQNDHVG